MHNGARHAMKEHFCISRESDQDLTGFKLGHTTVVGDRNYWFKGAVCSPRQFPEVTLQIETSQILPFII